ncbi:MAG: HlyD family efflux transporter periplasmic adaptor subunit [Saprospiraceae bacterium]|nr:HlyD family efflux transporter periplasmic adaptor subunit [Saprospiraceae bacterium]
MKNIAFFTLLLLLAACGNSNKGHDASGVFEAREVIISAEAAGVLRQFSINEGQQLGAGQQVGSIDCGQLDLQKAQITATESALRLRTTEAAPQVRVLNEQIALQQSQINTQREQLRVVQVEQARLQKLVAAKAAPAKQLDDVNGQVAVLEKQIAAAQTQVKVLQQQIKAQEESAGIMNRGILSEEQPLGARKAQLDDQIRRCTVINPIKGTVLSKYVEAFEMAAPGKALYKIANLDTLTLRAYVTGDQLAQIKLGQSVQVKVAQGDNPAKDYTGVINWISDKAEFTPKTIQTSDERANLVYAVKVATPNDGFLKIGMYADVKF